MPRLAASVGIALALLLAILLAWPAVPAHAQAAVDPMPLTFNDDAEEARFHALVAELRCVMCQNQSLADSNAQIAVDLRREVLGLMRDGKSDRQIKEFLVARYGEFVLYRPQLEADTWLLWFGPAALLLAGGVVIAVVVRRRSRQAVLDAGDGTDGQEW
ncbi:cytochrome c-type biogenesis protein [Montanilutibacter psychrotolerans]|uniref:Cytochrome c-type biogenesis protein n=1 Tax=Montanilutibacter psychrotolerans TaxID=1327343 RepID=A0A3M8SUJ5_9GAMM|nr:cytochrome c-type biogenesis protein [Lysobacter psychrotolerans]RNF83146.1 cytochrome c-type biogenesis protein CcmH [Lysobacter psychrotolerans]